MKFKGVYLGVMCLANRRCTATCAECTRTLESMFARDRDFWLRTLAWVQANPPPPPPRTALSTVTKRDSK